MAHIERVLPAVRLDDAGQQALRQTVLDFLTQNRAPVQVITTGLDGSPKIRLMGVWNEGFTMYVISRKPTHKLEELRRNPQVTAVWYRYDAATPGIEQPIRQVVITGTATLVLDAQSMRNMPGYARTVVAPRGPNDPPNRVTMESDDKAVERERFGIVIKPRVIRVEGFIPGPRYPVYLKP